MPLPAGACIPGPSSTRWVAAASWRGAGTGRSSSGSRLRRHDADHVPRQRGRKVLLVFSRLSHACRLTHDHGSARGWSVAAAAALSISGLRHDPREDGLGFDERARPVPSRATASLQGRRRARTDSCGGGGGGGGGIGYPGFGRRAVWAHATRRYARRGGAHRASRRGVAPCGRATVRPDLKAVELWVEPMHRARQAAALGGGGERSSGEHGGGGGTAATAAATAAAGEEAQVATAAAAASPAAEGSGTLGRRHQELRVAPARVAADAEASLLNRAWSCCGGDASVRSAAITRLHRRRRCHHHPRRRRGCCCRPHGLPRRLRASAE